ncbi:MAG TPA: helix-turn-helix transcriptional regulator [Candidatus Onthocola stercorigallinarum]|nr:helix-turn-helix transcriptional regulator [Candidatus Onthocola stercorigallinarum]
MEINATKYKGKDILKFIRENSNMTQKEFAKTINKTRDWQASNETGRSRYFIDDLIEIAKAHNLDIIIKDKTNK